MMMSNPEEIVARAKDQALRELINHFRCIEIVFVYVKNYFNTML